MSEDERESGDPGTAGGVSRPEDERELRILLERAVPRLPAPEERLRRVRERAARSRRRRRAAGTTAVAVAGLVVAGTLLPGFPRGGPDEGAPPAGPAPTVSATDTGAGRPVRFPDLFDLTLRLPPGWQALAVPGDPELGLVSRGYVASQRVPDLFTPPCPGNPEEDCDPVVALRPGGVLVSLDMKKFAGLHTKTQDPATLHTLTNLSVLCRKLTGTEEYSALLAGPDPAADLGIQVSVCAAGAGASSPILDDVRAMIAGAHYPAPGARPEPSTAPTTHARNNGGTDAHAN
ncbi:hypothetical protein GCM10011583_10550 [Streptomyces camponoticapitis]|uniref:Tat pathway signal sequence domain protein n=1 Tax=Streptomyces camponoticapitis TaxID=1616125 RepID=A0ABQ2E0V8_9ACTN|nr:hypothetical protein [Streptomyces camponoticapitis]GGJ80920.1 hypothetical protein GCM10011583_10550 [Streptomyces camponoticapitis]